MTDKMPDEIYVDKLRRAGGYDYGAYRPEPFEGSVKYVRADHATDELQRKLDAAPVVNYETELKIQRLQLAEFCLKRARGVDVLEPADHVYQLAKKVFKEHYGYEYGSKKP